MHHADFYLASAAVIPLLMFVDLASSAVKVKLEIPTVQLAQNLIRWTPGLVRYAWFFWWAFYGWAEWICLRSLETGRAATGGSTVVWIALTFLGIQAMGSGLSPDFSIRAVAATEPPAADALSQTER